MNVTELLKAAELAGASDLHLVAFQPPVIRVHGVLSVLGGEPLTNTDVEEALKQMASTEEINQFNRHSELDFSFEVPGVIRVRCNAARQRRTTSLALRLIPRYIPSFQELHLPNVCQELVTRPRGLVVISGPTGSGKSTTMAAMISYLNDNVSRRIVTIEDPIEYVYTDNKCIIMQRQIGDDTQSYPDALRHVLRHDPDVILVGEMRDTETAAAVLILAETGHLVLTTSHAPSSAQTIERIIDLFPPHQQNLAQTRLASLVIGILCQALVPSASDNKMVPAVEIMLANSAIRNLIREGKIYLLENIIRNNSQSGMQLMDHALVELYTKNLISLEHAFLFCNDRNEVERMTNKVETKQPSRDKLFPEELALIKN